MAKRGESLQQVKEQGRSWLVVSEDRDRVRREILPLLFHEEGASGLEVLKQTATRRMLRGRLEQGAPSFLVKVFRAPRMVDLLVSIFRVPRSRKEARISEELTRRSIPCPEFIASGILRSRGMVREDYALAWEIPGACPVLSWVQARLVDRRVDLREKVEVVNGFGRFVRLLHDQGVYSSDFHQGNIVLSLPPQGPPRFHLVDLHSLVLLPRPLDWAQRVATLAQLNDFRLPPPHRLRFLKAYLGPGEKRERKEFSRAIGQASLGQWKALWQRRKLRCLEAGKGVHEFRLGEWHGLVENGYRPEILLRLVTSEGPSAPAEEVETIKEGTRALILRGVYQDQQKRAPVVIKRFREEGKGRVCAWLRCARAKRAWINSHNLVMRGIATPPPLAFGEKRGGLGVRESFLATEEVVGAEAADRFLAERVKTLPEAQQQEMRKQFAGSLGALIRWMHQSGISHGDLKASNILVALGAEGVKLWVVDLDGVKTRRQVRERDVAKDLGRVRAAFAALFSPAEEEYFLRCYRKGHEFFKAREEKILAMARKRAEAKIAQKLKDRGA